MKYIIAFTLVLLSLKSISQCTVQSSSLTDGTLIYEASYENIFKNKDLENGIQAAYLKLVVYQNGTDNNKLQFFINVNSAKKGAKALLVPRKLIVNFNDGSNINIEAEDLEQIKSQNGFYMQASLFRINSRMFEDLQVKSITNVVVSDTRTNESFNGTPYSNLVLQQANCIASKIK